VDGGCAPARHGRHALERPRRRAERRTDLIYAAVLIVLALLSAGNTWGFGRMWAATPFVRRNTWLI
jgi:hypothetical protein